MHYQNVEAGHGYHSHEPYMAQAGPQGPGLGHLQSTKAVVRRGGSRARFCFIGFAALCAGGLIGVAVYFGTSASAQHGGPGASTPAPAPGGPDGAGGTPSSGPGGGGGSTVLPADVTLVPPLGNVPPVVPITSYNWYPTISYLKDNIHEQTIYRTELHDGRSDQYWDIMVDELLLARVPAILMHGRGCYDYTTDNGIGNMCPRKLDKFVAAMQRAGADSVFKVGMFIDTAQITNNYNHMHGGSAPLDMSSGNDALHHEAWWDLNIKIFFDIIPRASWFLMDGKPVIHFWTLSDNFFTNQEGNASRFLTWLKATFFARYGVEPFLVIQRTWFEQDSTITEAHADARHDWFSSHNDIPFTYATFNGKTTGLLVTSYRQNPEVRGCGDPCREMLRNNGTTLENGLGGWAAVGRSHCTRGLVQHGRKLRVLPQPRPVLVAPDAVH